MKDAARTSRAAGGAGGTGAASGAGGAAPLVELTRRDVLTGRELVESVHLGHLVAVDDAGRIMASIGDPDAVVYPRSALKPLQATVCLELIAEADPSLAASLTSQEVAISWASHLASPEQLAAVRSLAGRAGLDVDVDGDGDDHGDGDGDGHGVLSCPAAPGGSGASGPSGPSGRSSRLAHNCSGKHAMFALTARTLGLPSDRASLLTHDGPLQSLILARLTELLGPPRAIGVDGCGAPALALPLIVLARAFSVLAREDRFARVREGGRTHPQLIAGSSPSGSPLVDTALLASAADVIAKRGAEGVLAAGWRTMAGGVAGGGIAVKASDGAMRGAATALVAHLEASGVVPEGTWREPGPTGGGAIAGEVRAVGPVIHSSTGQRV